MVPFNRTPSNTRIPLVSVEFDASQAQQGPALLAYRGLLVGQKLNAGSAAADALVRAPNLAAVIALAGRGSMLHRMAIAWFAVNKSTELWLAVLADNAAGVQATGTIVVGSAATADGTIALYLGAVRIEVGVTGGQAGATIAANIATVINANPDLPITAVAAGATVTITFKHKGIAGNSYDLRHSFLPGEVLPAGVTLTITAMAGGTTSPSLANLFAAMSPQWFQIWAHTYTDATTLKTIEDELASRIGPERMLDGLAITSAPGTFSALATLGTSRNSPSSVIVAQPGANPLTPPWEFAAEVAALVAFYGAQDPGRPFNTLAMTNAMPIAETDQFDPSERNLLLFDGIATTKLAAGGVVQLERIITTYQTNPSGQSDVAYLDSTTLLTLLYLRFDLRNRFAKYARHKLANDGSAFGSGQPVMTPALGRAEVISWFEDNQDLALVEDIDQFKRDLVVERNKVDVNRLDLLVPPNLINGLDVVAALLQPRL